MSLLYKIACGLSLFCFGQISFCPDGHFVVLVRRYGPHQEVRARIEMPNSSKAEVVDILKHYWSYSRKLDHPFLLAMREAQIERMRNNSLECIIEKEGLVRALDDRIIPFKLFYGFNSAQEAAAQGVGKQLSPSELDLL